MGRKRWGELTQSQQAWYEDLVDLEDGETMADWWEVYMDAIEEDKSCENEGWPCDRE